MVTGRPRPPGFDKVRPFLASLRPRRYRLQWKLTLLYALVTAVTAVVLGIAALALVGYASIWSNALPVQMARGLLNTAQSLSSYLEQSPIDQAGVADWLHQGLVGNDLVIRMPIQERADFPQPQPQPEFRLQPQPQPEPQSPPPPPPPRVYRVVSLAITDSAGQVIVGYPDGTSAAKNSLAVAPETVPGFQAALQGVTDPEELATRNAAGNIVAAAPILGSERQTLGVIVVELAPPVSQSDFLLTILRDMVLPVVLGVLVVGGVIGVVVGYFIARDLTRRLHALAGAADAWSGGNFDVLVHDDSGDELGQVTQRLNQMALQLQTLLQTRQELATLDERNRLARDLHDAVKQQVFATAMQIGAAVALFDQDPSGAKACLMETDRLVHQTQQELKSLIEQLHPAALEDKGLAVALREHIGDWSRQNSISAEMRVRGEQPMPFLVEYALFRVAQEALANVARHSGATAVEVSLAWDGDQVELTLADNGRGFDPTVSTQGQGLGLRSMRERVVAIGGRLDVTSRAGGGTQVTVHCDGHQGK